MAFTSLSCWISCFLYTHLSLSWFTPSFWWSASSSSFLTNRKQIIWDLICLKMSLSCLYIRFIVWLDRKFQSGYHFPSEFCFHCFLVPTAVGEKAEGLSLCLSHSLSPCTSLSFLSFIKFTVIGYGVDLLISRLSVWKVLHCGQEKFSSIISLMIFLFLCLFI